jgi:hypothetical protein
MKLIIGSVASCLVNETPPAHNNRSRADGGVWVKHLNSRSCLIHHEHEVVLKESPKALGDITP